MKEPFSSINAHERIIQDHLADVNSLEQNKSHTSPLRQLNKLLKAHIQIDKNVLYTHHTSPLCFPRQPLNCHWKLGCSIPYSLYSQAWEWRNIWYALPPSSVSWNLFQHFPKKTSTVRIQEPIPVYSKCRWCITYHDPTIPVWAHGEHLICWILCLLWVCPECTWVYLSVLESTWF